MSSAGLIWDLFATDHASPAFLHVAGAADKAAASTAKASRGLEASVARMGKTGAVLTKRLTLPLAALAAVSIDQAAKFQKSMTLIQTAGGETEAKAAAISVGIKKVATSTGTSLSQLGDGIYTVAKAGATKWSAAGQLEVLRAAAQGAKAEAVPLGTAVDALSTIMFDYGAKTSDAVKYEDMLIRGSGLAKTSMQEYASSLSNVVPIAATVGISFDQVGGAIATMTQHGMSAQQATENLRNWITNLAGQNNVATAAMQQLGINTLDLSQNLGRRGLTGTLAIVDAALKAHTHNGMVMVDVHKSAALATQSLGTELGTFTGKLKTQSEGLLTGKTSIKDYTKFAKSMGGEAGAAALQFLALYKSSQGFSDQLRSGKGTYSTTVAALTKMMGGITGAGAAMQLGGKYAGQFASNTKAVGKAALDAGSDVLGWNKTQNTLAVKMDKAKASLQVMAVEIGTALIPAVSKLADGVRKAIHWLDGLTGGQKKVLLWSAGILLALGPILTIGARLAVVGRGMSTFAANAGSRIATLAGATQQTATKVANITRGMTRAVGGILAGAAASQVGGNSKGGWLAAVLLGAAGGGALGGLVGAAVGGVSAAIFKGIGLWNQHKDAAKAAALAEKTYVDSLTSAIEQDNGALGTNLRMTITKSLQDKGILDQAQKLGIGVADVVAAALGDSDAKQRIAASLADTVSGASAKATALFKSLHVTNNKALMQLTAGQSVKNDLGQTVHLTKAQLELVASLGQTAGNADALSKALAQQGIELTKAKAKADQFAHALNDNRAASGDFANRMSDLRQNMGVAVDANGQLTQSLARGTVVGQHNRSMLAQLGTAALDDANLTFNSARQHHTYADSLKLATVKLHDNIRAIEKAATAAGFSKSQTDALLKSLGLYGKLRPAPHLDLNTKAVTAKLATVKATLAALEKKPHNAKVDADIAAAKAKIKALQAQIDRLNGIVTVVIDYKTYTNPRFLAANGITNPAAAASAPKAPKSIVDPAAGAAAEQKRIADAQTASDKASSLAADTASKRDAISSGFATLLAAAHSTQSSASELRSAASELYKAAKAGGASAAALSQLSREQRALTRLGQQRDSVNRRLGTGPTGPTAYDRLASAKQSYSDERSGVKGGITGSFDIATAGQNQFNEPVTFSAIRRQLQKAVANAKKFTATLKRLGREGLNKALLSQLALAGPAALPEALALASATPKQLAALNSEFKQLNTAGSGAGKYMADQMYGAGVKSAQGLVNGLKSQQSALNKAIKNMGDQMVAQLRRTLNMHSPSRRLYDEARLAFSGYENGIQSKHRDIARAAAGAGEASIPGRPGGRLAGGGNTYNFHNEMHAHYPLEGDLQEAVKTLTRMSARQMREAGERLGV